MTVAIPPQNTAAGMSGIVQKDHHFASTGMGLKIVGFKVECDIMDTYGDYYMYFDDLRVVSDLYEIDLRDKDDMADFWQNKKGEFLGVISKKQLAFYEGL